MKLIVGLGNPGSQYIKTRHNVGFMVIDQLLEKYNLTTTTKLKAELIKTKLFNEDVVIAKPITYMNLSGESVLAIAQFYKIKTEDILVIYDDLDLAVGKMRLRKSGSSGGQNGMKNILNLLNTQAIKRIRIGIGKDARIPTVDYVLGKFNSEQTPIINDVIIDSVKAVETFIQKDFDTAMNGYNK